MASSPDNSGEILICCICLDDYNETNRTPMVLGKCGHSICSSCLEPLTRHGQVSCPKCRQRTASRDIKVNYDLRDAAIQNRWQAKACDEKGEKKPRPPTPPRQHNLHPSPRQLNLCQRDESESEVNPWLVAGATIAGAAVFTLTGFLIGKTSNKRN